MTAALPTTAPTPIPSRAGRWRELSSGSSRKTRIGVALLAVLLASALVGPLLVSHDPITQDLGARLQSPGGSHLLGTDALGRDELSRLVHAMRTDLTLGFLAAFLPMVLGTVLGAVAGLGGRVADVIVMRACDLIQAFPIYIFMVALVYALGAGPKAIIVAFTAVGWVVYARLTRTAVLKIRSLDYVLAARAAGLPRRRVMFGHVLPNTLAQTLVYFPADVLLAILSLAAFSFLGLGIQPPSPEWGSMIADGQGYARTQWWLVAFPGLAVMIVGVALVLISDGLEERLNRR